MTNVSNKHLLIGKSFGQFGGGCQFTAGIVPYIDDQSVACGKFLQHFAQISIPDSVFETFAVYITNVIVQYFILERGGDFIISPQIDALYAVAEAV